MDLKTIRFLIEGMAVWVVVSILKLLPVGWASNLGGALGRTLGPLLPKARRTDDNLARFMGHLDEEERHRIARDMWDNLGRVAAEYVHIPDIRKNLESHIEIVGLEHLEALREDGKPGILFSAHLGNWEMATLTSLVKGLPLSVIYRPANNRFVNNQIRRAQGTLETKLIAKGAKGARELMSVLTHGGHIFMMVDQKMTDGMEVPFFGEMAWTAPAAARLSLRYDCPLVPIRVERLGREPRFRVTVYPPLDKPVFDETLGLPKDHPHYVYSLMVRVNGIIEGWIHERPEQWLWIHRRWS